MTTQYYSGPNYAARFLSIVLALLLPHPFTISIAHVSAANAQTPLQIFSHFIKTSSQS